MEVVEKAFGKVFQVFVPSNFRTTVGRPNISISLPKPVSTLTEDQRNNVLKQLSAIRKYIKETT